MLDLAIFKQLYVYANLNLIRYSSLTSSEQPTETPLEQTPFSYSPRCHHTPAMPRYVEYKNRRNIWSLIKKFLRSVHSYRFKVTTAVTAATAATETATTERQEHHIEQAYHHTHREPHGIVN